MKTLGLLLAAVAGLASVGCAGNKAAATSSAGTGATRRHPHPPPTADTEQVQAYDLHRSGKPDVWVYSVTVQGRVGEAVQRRVRQEADLNGDGKVDIVYYFDAEGQVTKETLDLDFDGKVDDTLFFEKGKKVRSEKDLDGDGRVDTWSFYDAQREAGPQGAGREGDRQGGLLGVLGDRGHRPDRRGPGRRRSGGPLDEGPEAAAATEKK